MLTLVGHVGSWWVKRTAPTAGACTAKTGGTYTHGLTNLNASTSYTYTAYSGSGCTTTIDTVTFTTPAAPSLTAGSVTHNSATLTLTDHTGNWWIKRTAPQPEPAPPRPAAPTPTASPILRLLLLTSTLLIRIRGCTTSIDTVTFTTPAAGTLTADSVSHDSATLTLTGRTGNWWIKRTAPTTGTCTAKTSSAYTHDLTGLNASTAYTYTAYSDSGCATTIDTAAFTTPAAPALTAGSVAHDSATLTLTDHTGNWWIKRTTPPSTTCTTKTSSITAHSLTGLTPRPLTPTPLIRIRAALPPSTQRRSPHQQRLL